VSQVHRGSREKILASVYKGLSSAREKLQFFLDAWGVARKTPVRSEETIRQWLIEKNALKLSEKERDRVVASVLAAWHKEPGDTLADCANAVSRAAHEDPFATMDFREEMERLSARMVLVPR